jgi:hypothetical protein
MPCFKPLEAYLLADGSVVFHPKGDVVRDRTLPCGQCVGCRLERSRQWAVRCVHEASLHERNCYITLTYSDEFLPDDGSLHYEDFQLFMRYLRRKFGKVRFYMCGEYGEDFTHRPHFHACLFGVDFSDKKYFGKSPAGAKMFTSAILDGLWKKGFCTVQDLTFDSAAYVARYVMKKVTGDRANAIQHDGCPGHYTDIDTGVIRTPEFNHMSLKPGIGATWFDTWKCDVFPHDRVVVNGSVMKPPKYYSRRFSKLDGFAFEDIQFKRFEKFRDSGAIADSSPDRLAVREVVTKARLAFKKRI